jgi:hypothetical protein
MQSSNAESRANAELCAELDSFRVAGVSLLFEFCSLDFCALHVPASFEAANRILDERGEFAVC